MSVFTPLDEDTIRQFLEPFNVGALLAWQGISGGSENSNFFVDTNVARFVLTLVERGDAQHLPFMISLLDCLHHRGLPVPHALCDRNGQALHRLAGRPALLQPRLQGEHPLQVDAAHCAALGAVLCQMHDAAANLPSPLSNPRGLDWTLRSARHLTTGPWQQHPGLPALLDQLAAARGQLAALPMTVIHADLFRDNVLFAGQQLSGVIDFYNAGADSRLYDLAICVNDWCFVPRGDVTAPALSLPLYNALLSAYCHAGYAFSGAEQDYWPLLLRLAALRFWVSRHHYHDLHDGQQGILVKNPVTMRDILFWHLGNKVPTLP